MVDERFRNWRSLREEQEILGLGSKSCGSGKVWIRLNEVNVEYCERLQEV